jgi:signal peptidase
MQNPKTRTIEFCILIVIYIVLRVNYFESLGETYTYLVNPLFWIILAITIKSLLNQYNKNKENIKFKKKITEYTLIACLIYVIIYLISGLFVTFGENPYSTTLKGIVMNIWGFGTVLISKEYIRYRLINNVLKKDKKLITILVTILFILIDFEIWNQIDLNNLSTYTLMAVICQKLIPIIAENVLFSYLAVNNNFTSSVIYAFLTNLYLWISPILPNTPWIMDTIIDVTIPTILLLYIRYEKSKLDQIKIRERLESTDPRGIMPFVIVSILVIWFAIGVFPIKPVAIASGSMEPIINIGDIAIIKECEVNDVNVGDIIEYQKDDYTIVHRITKKVQRDGEFYFTTKGDNNEQADNEEVTESQLVGKVFFKVRYLGYPAVWLDFAK